MKKIALLILVSLTLSFSTKAQNTDSIIISKIYNEALVGKTYENLYELSTTIGPRLSGSEGDRKAVAWSKKLLESYGFDKVWLQEVQVPHWVRGEKEVAYYTVNGKNYDVAICALGGSIATPAKGITAEVIEVFTFDQLEELGEKNIKGKIVFFNRPMNPTSLNTFSAYGGAVNQRSQGAAQAAKYGAVGVIVRSMSTKIDNFPHTGAMRYDPLVTQIPAAAISTLAANQLSAQLKINPKLKFHYKMSCQTLPDAISYNVIGEITGSEFPNEYILVGGHLDSWDLGDGSHDDGAGCMQSVEVLRLFKTMGIKPKRTLRVVLFANEENGLRGALKYAEYSKENNVKHLVAIESDSGGFTPRGFTIDSNAEIIQKFLAFKELLSPYGINEIGGGGGGADIGPLKPQGVPLVGFRPDSQRYFDYHHAATDRIEAVNERELKLGSAAITALVYLLDKYGL